MEEFDNRTDPQDVSGTDAGEMFRNKQRKLEKNLLYYLHDLCYLLCVVMILFLLCFRIVIVSGSSMKNTLVDGDYLLLLSNSIYHNPKQGDIIVASKESFDNGAPIVKRVIAVAGQEVDIDFETSTVYVDGIALEEDYVYTPTDSAGGISFPLTVEDGCLFVMGDNRSNSKDSRYIEIGLIDRREVLGKAFFLFLPGKDKGNINRDFSRIGGLY